MADWTKILSRGNVEDRRAVGPVAIGGISLTGVALLILFNVLTGGSPTDVLQQLENIPIQQQLVNPQEFEGQDTYEVFSSTVLGSNNDMWKHVFGQTNKSYTDPRLVLFRSATDSACGGASVEMGPHYCPLDQTIYLDETFFDELTKRFGARGGDVAQAYVMAHEVGHHAQNGLGLMEQVRSQMESNSDNQNSLSIKLELQADCFAGLWLHSIKDKEVLEKDEVHEAMDAAAAVGDDRIQKKMTGTVNPETWTHGSSEQRLSWFDRGYERGTLSACDTFN